jgi:hypothetical protein
MKFSSGGAFRRALEDRLRSISLQKGEPLIRLRKLVAFDRFLARLILDQPGQWIVKGGLALQLRIKDHSRTTKDIDMLVFAEHQEILPALKISVYQDLGDWFSFEVIETSNQRLENFGGFRYQIHSLLDGRTFEGFHVDVGLGDPMVEPADYFSTPPLLEFAGLKPTLVPCFPVSQQIAEKVHAYTRPRLSGEPSRVKDFVDILLLAKFGEINRMGLLQAIQATFQFAGTHPVPTNIPLPPQSWTPIFKKMANDVGLIDTTLDQAYSKIQQFIDPLLKGEIVGTHWNPESWTWK